MGNDTVEVEGDSSHPLGMRDLLHLIQIISGLSFLKTNTNFNTD